jgi:hypothetical protein
VKTRDIIFLVAVAAIAITAVLLTNRTTLLATSATPTDFPNGIRTPSVTLMNGDDPVVTFTLSRNNQRRAGRLHIRFESNYPSEIEIEPGPSVGNRRGTIISQIMQWGPRTASGTNRTRLTTSIVSDAAGGLAGVIDATTNDPSGSPGQAKSTPLVLNAGERNGLYVTLYPGDNTISFEDRGHGTSTGHIPLERLVRHFRSIPK